MLRTAQVPQGLLLAGPRRCLHKFTEILFLQKAVFLIRGFPRPELPWAQTPPSPWGVSVLCSRLPPLQRRQELGNLVSPPSPTFAWLWQAGPCAFQTGWGWLRGFVVGYETLLSKAACPVLAVQGASSSFHERSWELSFRWERVGYLSKAVHALLRHLEEKKRLHFLTNFLPAWGIHINWQRTWRQHISHQTVCTWGIWWSQRCLQHPGKTLTHAGVSLDFPQTRLLLFCCIASDGEAPKILCTGPVHGRGSHEGHRAMFPVPQLHDWHTPPVTALCRKVSSQQYGSVRSVHLKKIKSNKSNEKRKSHLVVASC